MDYTNALRTNIKDPNATLEVIPFMTNSYGQRRAVSYTNDIRMTGFAIRADAKNPEELVKFLDWTYSKEGIDITNYGKEGVTFRYNSQGIAEYLPEFVNRFLGRPSVYYAVFTEAGVTMAAFAPVGGNSKNLIEVNKIIGNWAGPNERYWNLVQEEHRNGALKTPMAAPPFTAAQMSRITQLRQALDNYIDQEFDKFILGREPINNWDRVIAECIRLGSRELEEIYNTANAPYR